MRRVTIVALIDSPLTDDDLDEAIVDETAKYPQFTAIESVEIRPCA